MTRSEPMPSQSWTYPANGMSSSTVPPILTADLILAQSTDLSEDGKDRIHGYGNLKADSLTIPITGTGLLSNDTLDMGIKLGSGSAARKSIEKYVLRLFMGKNTLSGSYELYNSDMLTGKAIR